MIVIIVELLLTIIIFETKVKIRGWRGETGALCSEGVFPLLQLFEKAFHWSDITSILTDVLQCFLLTITK